MLCHKCQQKEAQIHLTMIVDGSKEGTVDLCKDCAPPMGFDLEKFDPKQIQELSVVGKKCAFCGAEAFSCQLRPDGAAEYWCNDCCVECALIYAELMRAERPDLLTRPKDENSFISFLSDPDLQAWSSSANQRALQILKDRRRQDGRDR